MAKEKRCNGCKNCNCDETKQDIINSLKWIDEVAEIRPNVNYSRTTYGLKHLAESYISNSTHIGEDNFIKACEMRGLKLKQVSKKSYCVNLFNKDDPKRLPKYFYKYRG